MARPPVPHPCRLVRVALLAVCTACSASGAEGVGGSYYWSPDTLDMQPRLLQSLGDTAPRNAQIGRPMAVRTNGDTIFVSDVTVDRVAVLDSLGNVVRWIGAHGRGPGELYGASHLDVRGNRLLVAEALNGRVSEFTLDGHFVRAYASPYAAGGVVSTASNAISVSRSARHYALRLEAHGTGTSALRRTVRVRHDEKNRWNGVPGHDLLAADSSQVWVFDQGSGNVCVYADPRATAQCRPLPKQLLDRLTMYRDSRVADLERATRQYVQAAPLAKDMVRVGSWLAILLPLPDVPIVLLDVTDASVTPVIPHSLPIPPWVRSATSLAWDGRGFILAGEAGIGRVYVARRSSTPSPH